MARKWILRNTTPPIYLYNPNACEEMLAIASYLEIKPFISLAEQRWANEFEHRYFENGENLSSITIAEINLVRKRKSLMPMLGFYETDIDAYARTSTKQQKAEFRCQLRDQYLDADAATRLKAVNLARAQSQALPPPHHTFTEWEERREMIAAAGMSPKEINGTKVLTVRKEAIPPPPPTPPTALTTLTTPTPSTQSTLDAAMANRLLKLVEEDELRAQIVAAMAGNDALVAAENSEDKALRGLLVRRALQEILPQAKE